MLRHFRITVDAPSSTERADLATQIASAIARIEDVTPKSVTYKQGRPNARKVILFNQTPQDSQDYEDDGE